MKSILAIIMLITSTTGLAAGFAMTYDSSGMILGLKSTLLESTPFRNYFIPGIIYIFLIGIPASLCLILINIKSKVNYNICLSFNALLIVISIIQLAILSEYSPIATFFLIMGITGALTSAQLSGKEAI